MKSGRANPAPQLFQPNNQDVLAQGTSDFHASHTTTHVAYAQVRKGPKGGVEQRRVDEAGGQPVAPAGPTLSPNQMSAENQFDEADYDILWPTRGRCDTASSDDDDVEVVTNSSQAGGVQTGSDRIRSRSVHDVELPGAVLCYVTIPYKQLIWA